MLRPMLNYEHLLMIIGRCEEEKFALVLEMESMKQRIDDLEKELEASRQLVRNAETKETGEANGKLEQPNHF